MKKIIVSGASGFIGQALIHALIEQGVEAYGLCSHPEKWVAPVPGGNLHIMRAEFTDYKKLPQIINGQGFDAFVHLAWQGYGTAKNDYAVQFANVAYACDAVEAAVSCRCKRFLFVSSIHEFLKDKNANGEDGFCSIYGAAKRAARHACQVMAHNNGIEFTAVLLNHVFGPGTDSPRASNQIIRKMINEGRAPLTDGKNLCDWIYIDDCVRGILSALKHGRPGATYYLGGESIRTFAELMKEVRDLVAPQARLEFGMYPDTAFVDYSGVDVKALGKDTGYMPACDFRTSVLKTAEWVRRQGLDG